MSKEKSKGFEYQNSISTELCLEIPTCGNDFLTEKRYLAGYDIEALTESIDFIDAIYLLFKQELPSREQSVLLNRLFIALLNAGPRDHAVRAAMLAGVSKAKTEHLLPIGLNILGGENNGAQSVAKSYAFITKHAIEKSRESKNVNSLLQDISKSFIESSLIDIDYTNEFTPGFGQSYGSSDQLTTRLAKSVFSSMPDSEIFQWCLFFNEQVKPFNMSITPIGLAAAVFCELGIGARESVGLYQLLRAPGIFAHGVEQTHKPITSMPMLGDEDYHFTPMGEGDE